jgi:hypothetical protein
MKRSSDPNRELSRIAGFERAEDMVLVVDQGPFEAPGLSCDFLAVARQSGGSAACAAHGLRHKKVNRHGHGRLANETAGDPGTHLVAGLKSSMMEELRQFGLRGQFGRLNDQIAVGGKCGHRDLALPRMQIDCLGADQDQCLTMVPSASRASRSVRRASV